MCIICCFRPPLLLPYTESKVGWGGEERVISVTPPLHFYDQLCLWGLLPTDLGPRYFWTGAICHCHPQGGVVSRGEGLCAGAGADMSIWVHVCVWVYHSELPCRVIHINEHLCLRGKRSYWNAFSVFAQHRRGGEKIISKHRWEFVCVRQRLRCFPEKKKCVKIDIALSR